MKEEMNNYKSRGVKNEQLVMRYLRKQKTPLTITCRELASKIKTYDQKFNLTHPSPQGIIDILKRLEPVFIMRDMTGSKMRIIINKDEI